MALGVLVAFATSERRWLFGACFLNAGVDLLDASVTLLNFAQHPETGSTSAITAAFAVGGLLFWLTLAYLAH